MAMACDGSALWQSGPSSPAAIAKMRHAHVKLQSFQVPCRLGARCATLVSSISTKQRTVLVAVMSISGRICICTYVDVYIYICMYMYMYVCTPLYTRIFRDFVPCLVVYNSCYTFLAMIRLGHGGHYNSLPRGSGYSSYGNNGSGSKKPESLKNDWSLEKNINHPNQLAYTEIVFLQVHCFRHMFSKVLDETRISRLNLCVKWFKFDLNTWRFPKSSIEIGNVHEINQLCLGTPINGNPHI